MDYKDKRRDKRRDNRSGNRIDKGQEAELNNRNVDYWDEEEEEFEEAPRQRSRRSRQFSTGFLSKAQKQTIAAVCMFFVILAAKYGNDPTGDAVYGVFKTALSKDNDYTIALTQAAKGVFGGAEGRVIAVNNPADIMLLPVQGTIANKFGKLGNDKKPNKGIDISAPLGSNVQVPLGGVVLQIGNDPVLGRYVKVEHGNGLSSILSNLGEVRVSSKQKVKQGDLLGTLGFTSAIKRPWLHWEVYRGSQPIDPETLLGKAGNKV